MNHRTLILPAAIALTSSVCCAESLYKEARYELQPAATAPADKALTEEKSVVTKKSGGSRFGTESQEWITIGTGGSHDFSGNAGYDIHASWSTFIIEDVEFSLELATWYYQQKGENAFGINPQFIFRYHYYKSDDAKWTLFAEAGIGLLFATRDVPVNGSSFAFTPRAGFGVTRQLTDDLRLQVGIRWAHISNARINGDSRNPSRDSLMLYAGLMFEY